jgi:hypothetical protein
LHITQAPPSPSIINPEISPAVESVILKALDKKPKNRYQSGAQLMSALEEAFESKTSAPKMSLPPLPVGVPTVRHNKVSVDQMTRHLKQPKGKKNVNNLPAAQPPKKKNNKWMILLLLLLLLLGIGGWFCATSGLYSMGFVSAPSFTPSRSEEAAPEPVQPTQALIQPSAVPPTQTAIPSATPPATVTATSTASPTPTVSPTLPPLEPTAAATSTPQPDPVVGVPTIKYPDGNNLTLFWNETSFVMLNRSRESRSLSGFTFERLDQNDQPTDTLPGFRLESRRFKYIPGKNCVSVKTYNDETPPYLDPPDCLMLYSSILQPDKEVEPEIFFWTEKEDSTQFRVLWLGEEVARCETSAGTCELYIP